MRQRCTRGYEQQHVFSGAHSPSGALQAFSLCSLTAGPYGAELGGESSHWPLARNCFCCLLQLAWPVCSAHWTTSSPLSQSCTPHHIAQTLLQARIAGTKAAGLVFGASFIRSLPLLVLSLRSSNIVTSFAFAFPCPHVRSLEASREGQRPTAFLPRTTQAFVLCGWVGFVLLRFVPSSSSFIAKGLSRSIVLCGYLRTPKRGACSQPCGAG